MQIYPDVTLKNATAGSLFRAGLVVRDSAGGIWGLTARHVFDGSPTAEIQTTDGTAISQYCAEDNIPAFAQFDASNQIVHFPIARAFAGAQHLRMDVTWPRDAVEPNALLGTTAVLPETPNRVFGTISEVNGIARVRLGADQMPLIIRGTALLFVDVDDVAASGMAGMLILSQAGEAVGIGIAVQRSEQVCEFVVCPAYPYLQKFGYRLWAPPGAHWSDLQQRVALFVKDADSDPGPDLGPRPALGQRF